MDIQQAASHGFPEVVVVEASAGSGKTYALTKRYLQLLINPYTPLKQIPLRNILAITFTNKATVEMKERIIGFLKQIAFDSFPSQEQKKDIYASLAVDEEFARQKALLVMDELIKHYDFFQVKTIDSFINAVLLGCALNIDRSANFKIKGDYSLHLSYCLDMVIEQAPVNERVFKILKDFLQHYLQVENRNGWFPKEDILDLMRSLFKLINKYGGLFQKYKGKSVDLIKKKNALFEEIKALSEELPEGLSKTARNSILKFINENEGDIFDIKDLPPVFQKPFVPVNKGCDSPEILEKKWNNIHQEIKNLVEMEATIVYNPYVELFHDLLGEIQRVSRKEDILFLEELNRSALSLFGEGGVTVAELYYRLATRYRHYLIDEFQDTSVLQWNNLYLMIEDALSCGGSLFYVGDKKQAIYRFRGGQVQLFDKVKENFRHFNVQSAYLTKNWRSHKEIVEFNNSIFSRDNLKKALELSGITKELGDSEEAVNEIVDVFGDSFQESRPDYPGGYVRIERINEKNQEERDAVMQEKVIAIVHELKNRGFWREDIAFLVRDNAEVQLVTSWLLSAGFPVESEKTLNVLENYLIKELISFLSFLHSPINDLSFASFILGNIFSQASRISHDQVTDFIFNLRQKRMLNSEESLYRLFREQYPEIWKKLFDEFFKNVGFISLYELMISIYNRFEIMAKFPENQAFLMKFLELIKSKEEEYIDLGGFLDYLGNALPEDLYVNVTHSDSIKVFTIHKAKGLEFPVVVIPFLRMEITPETGGKGTRSHIEDETAPDLGLIRITKHYCEYSEKLRAIYTRDYKKACIDELNNIYVALTRPQKELYIFIPRRSANSNNKMNFLIPQDVGEKGIPGSYGLTRRENSQPLISIPVSVYRDWISSLKEEFSDISRIRNRKIIQEGSVIHKILSYIGNIAGRDKNELIRQSVEQAELFFPAVDDFTNYKVRVTAILNEPGLCHFFNIPDGEVFCEKEVVNRLGDTRRIDRLIVRPKEVWVVDYKSSGENEDAYKQQVKDYVELIGDIYPDKAVKGFIIYLDQRQAEEINECGG